MIVATEKEQFVPGRDPEGILLADILEAVRTPADRPARPIAVRSGRPAVARVDGEVEAAMREQASATESLKDLIAAETADRRAQPAPSLAGDGHLLEQDRTHAGAAARIDVVAHRRDALEHVAQIAGDGDLGHRDIELTPFSTQKPAAPRE